MFSVSGGIYGLTGKRMHVLEYAAKQGTDLPFSGIRNLEVERRHAIERAG
jgi:hypothetical protein